MKEQVHRALCAILVAGASFAQGSDDCVTADPIAGEGCFAFSTLGSTDSGLIGSCSSPPSSDVWFAWTSGAATDYLFAICDTDYDAVVAIYDACGGTELGCEDADGCTPSLNDVELTVFGLSPATTYLIQVDGWTGLEGTGTLEISAIVPPMNDACAFALPISGAGVFEFDNTAASTDGGSDAACQAFGSAQIESDVWFDWTAPSTGAFSVETWGFTELDTRVAVYDAQACPPIGALACDDDACQFQSRLEFSAVSGLSYLIRVGSFSPVTKGEGFFEVRPVVPPVNDDCSGATPIAGAGPFAFDNASATTDGAPDLLCGSVGNQIERDVWYSWTAPSNGPFQVTTCGGTTLDTVVAVYADQACPANAPLACNDNACGVQSAAVFGATAGQAYLVRVGSFGDVHRAAGTFAIDVPPLPPSDDCANAAPIGGTGLFPFDTRGATTDGGSEALCSHFSAEDVHNDVWFRWTAPATDSFRIETCGLTTLDTRLAVYADQACPPVAPLACDDDACSLQSEVTFAAAAGSSYLVRLGSWAVTSEGAGDFAITAVGGEIGTTYCTGAPNSVGPGASITARGSEVVAVNDFKLESEGAPSGVFGIFYYGPTQISVPFGDGVRCVGGTTQRLQPPVMTSPGGSAARAVDLASPPALDDLVAASAWNFQFWYRDTAAMGTGFNLTDGVNVSFQ